MARARKAPVDSAPGVPEAFHRVAAHVERARAALTSAMPTARREGTSPAEALHQFESSLLRARELMDDWRPVEADPRFQPWWACLSALDQCLSAAERLRLEAPPLDFEQQALLFGDLIAPLQAFDEATRMLRKTPR